MRSVLLVAVVAAFSQGCGGDGTAPGGAESARLSLASASSDAGGLDLLLNGRTVAHAVARGASAAVTVAAGPAMGEIRATGSSEALASVPLTLEAGESYTVVAAGPHRALTVVVSVDTGSAAPPESPPFPPAEPPDSSDGPSPDPHVARFRIVHAAPHAPALDPYLTEVGFPLDTAPLFRPFAYGSLALILDAVRRPGRYGVQFTEEGTRRVVLESGEIAAEAGELLTVVLGENADQSLRVDVVGE